MHCARLLNPSAAAPRPRCSCPSCPWSGPVPPVPRQLQGGRELLRFLSFGAAATMPWRSRACPPATAVRWRFPSAATVWPLLPVLVPALPPAEEQTDGSGGVTLGGNAQQGLHKDLPAAATCRSLELTISQASVSDRTSHCAATLKFNNSSQVSSFTWQEQWQAEGQWQVCPGHPAAMPPMGPTSPSLARMTNSSPGSSRSRITSGRGGREQGGWKAGSNQLRTPTSREGCAACQGARQPVQPRQHVAELAWRGCDEMQRLLEIQIA